MYVLESVFEFVKKLVNVFATFLKFILKRVRPAYQPVASFQEVSCLSVLRFEKFVLVCVRNEFAVIQSFKVVIVDINLRDYSSRPISRCKSGNVSCIIPELSSLSPSAKIVPYTCYNRGYSVRNTWSSDSSTPRSSWYRCSGSPVCRHSFII